MERRIKLKTLNSHITCKICRGYFIDATTVTECLHTFCKSCLVKHLEENNTCPTCTIVIHQSHPLQYISFDRTMQDIVYKLVNVCLECISTSLRTLKRSFIRCSAQATITHLKKFVAKKVLNGMDKYREIDILCNDELLGKDHTLKFVYVTRWRFRDPPLRLQN
ncbi:Ring finger protein [Operophtera brumata]|uniref:Ring finger protein n=1 Tax=Operophtera brumata TaxID=104452 RepID=A0A0L7LMT8_OPEBR|nr:Ring finger protein [Operophtera brumata]